MNSIIDLLNRISAFVVGVLLLPFGERPGIYALIFVSVVAGLVLLLLYGKLSNQSAIKKVKSDIYARILESVLYRNDIRVCLSAQLGLFRAGVRYFLLAVPPILVLCIPTVLILSQLNLFFAVRPVKEGETLIVTAKLSESSLLKKLKVKPGDGVSVSGPVRNMPEGVFALRADARTKGAHSIDFEVGESSYSLPLFVGSGPAKLWTFYSDSAWWRLLYPKIDDVAPPVIVKELFVEYPAQDLSLAGLEMNWLIVFLVVSVLSGLVFSKIFGVEV